ncbi:response regulator transcription factor [Gordonibacter sp. An230]|uniref:response regulator transcription factor n=1 Tax=Gordonibacter sp. An230 TaxID=1965592 RepID=UPI0013A66D0D|nr:helix-turn-helix transcriptional regulator [Gordonibacter sp. An230]
MPFLGMSFFWVYFRYQSFFGLLYPFETEGLSLVYPALLALLLVLCAAAVSLGGLLGRVMHESKLFVPLAGVFGSAGVALSFAAAEGLLPPWIAWAALPFVVFAFEVGCLAWALFFCERFSFESVAVMVASFGASLLALSHGLPHLVAVAVPAVVGVTWRFAPPLRACRWEGQGLVALKGGTPCVVLLIAFLMAGSVLRGVVDTVEPGSDSAGLTFRWLLSIVLSGGMLACVVRCAQSRKGVGRGASGEGGASPTQLVERMTFKMWMALSLLFFAAVFGGVLEGTYVFSGNAVVAVRSMFDVLFWVALCGLSHARGVSPVLVFSVFGIPTDVVSWALSYVAIPGISGIWIDGGSVGALDALILLAAFVSLASVVVVLGALLTKRGFPVGFAEGDGGSALPIAHPPRFGTGSLSLTEREVEVVSLFARGYSVKKVASLLFVSASTVQSHMKSAYRKLGVHSRDELIERLSGDGLGRAGFVEGQLRKYAPLEGGGECGGVSCDTMTGR